MKLHEKEFKQFFKDWQRYEYLWNLWEISYHNTWTENGVWTDYRPMTKEDVGEFGNDSFRFRRIDPYY